MIDGLRRQLRSVIEWEDPSPDVLFHRWTDNGDEIKNASKLIVGPGQGCIFVYEGKVEAVIEKKAWSNWRPTTSPSGRRSSKFMQRFASEHKVGIFFFRIARCSNQKWGTPSPIGLPRPEVRVSGRAGGLRQLQLPDQGTGLAVRDVVGGSPLYTVEDSAR